MKNIYIITFCYLLLFPFSSNAQTLKQGNTKVNWINTDYMPGHIPAFEENKGQFPAVAAGRKILYGCNYDGVEIFLTDKGIIYNISKPEKEDEDAKEEKEDIDKEPRKKRKITYQHIFIDWENASANPTIEAQEAPPYYFSEGMLEHPDETITNIKGFQKIVYHNLYPGIDLEFYFHKGKGIEYTIKVQPGFDASVFKMHYTGASSLAFDKAHNLHIGTIIGDVVDYAPMVTSGGNEIPSSFKKSTEDEITFKLDNATYKNALVIDPWTVFPISPATYACDVGLDVANNTYVLEYSYSSYLVMYLQKYNASGGLEWTYKLNEFTPTPLNPIEVDSSSCSPVFLSDFVVDAHGNSYIAAPLRFANSYNSFNTFGMVSLNALGTRKYLNYTYSADSIWETWNVSYSCSNNLLIAAGCSMCCDAVGFDGINIATGNPIPGEYINDSIGEVQGGCIAPNGNYYAIAATSRSGYYSFTDLLLCCNITKTSAKLQWKIPIQYGYTDAAAKCAPDQIGNNGITASYEYLYTSDGLVLDQRSLSAGNIIRTINIPGGNNYPGTANSGLAVDSLGNVYAGSYNAIYVYDKNLNSIGSFTSLPGKVFDVRYNSGVISACGYNSSTSKSFVVQMNVASYSNGIISSFFCTEKDTGSIVDCSNFIVPNVFTPNYKGIGIDNMFYIKTPPDINTWSLVIFDRWGKEMFKTTEPTQYWNGTTESGGQAPDGVYYYMIDATCQNNTYKKDGFVQLIR